MLEKLRRTIGFVLLLLSSLTYMGLTDTNGANFAVWIGYLLMTFAWTDYFSFVIYTFPAFGAIAGFLVGNLDGVLYGLPTGLAFVVFAALLSRNRERLATLVFLLSIPMALVNSYAYPISSPVNWALIGLMVGLIENAVVEEMAEGDVFIIALYFMALGPLAFIPTAFQLFTGRAFFEKRFHGGSYYPVGPATFVVAVPLFILVPALVGGRALPEWLFYAHFHGVQRPGWGILAGLAATFGLPYLLADYQRYSSDSELSLAGGTMGAVAGLVAGVLTLAAVGLVAIYVGEHGRETLAGVLAIGAFIAAVFVGGVTGVEFSKLHYAGESSIDAFRWFLGINVAALVLSIAVLVESPSNGELPILTGALTTALFLVSVWDEREYLGTPWLVFLLFLAFVSGLWVGLGIAPSLEAHFLS